MNWRSCVVSFFLVTSVLPVAEAFSFTVVENTDTLGCYDIYELTISHEDSIYLNVWEDAWITVEFYGPSGDTVAVGGFYYDTDTWKVRLAPTEEGGWSWFLVFGDSSGTLTAVGDFTSVPSNNPGFVRKSAVSPYRFQSDNGEPFYPLGFDVGFGWNRLGDEMGFDGPPAPCSNFTDRGTYWAAYQSAGVNIIRQSINNGCWNLFQSISPSGNVYLVTEGSWSDTVSMELKQHDFRHWLGLFSWSVPFNNEHGDTAKMNAVKRYVKYCIDRYGAYVDIWEIANEANIETAWLDIIVPYLKSIDPYSHPVTTSWERPELDYIDFSAPHQYNGSSDFNADRTLANTINVQRGFGKPVLFGEYGNSGRFGNYSPLRFRLYIWTAFLKECGLVFWNTSYQKIPPYYWPGPGNMYMGPEERAEISALWSVMGDIPLTAAETIPLISDPANIRGYALSDSFVYGAYLHHYTSHYTPVSGETLTVTRSTSNNTAEWYDPETATLIDSVTFGSGTTPLLIPTFTIDIAVVIHPGSTSVEEGLVRRARNPNFKTMQATPNPFRGTTSIRYTVPGGNAERRLPVRIEVYDLTGRRVETLLNKEQKPGVYRVQWEAKGRASGMYFCRFQVSDFTVTRKLTLLK